MQSVKILNEQTKSDIETARMQIREGKGISTKYLMSELKLGSCKKEENI